MQERKTPNYYIVKASALPEVFLKVAEAKRLLATGQVPTVNDAAKAVGLSRSAFYKYRDTIMSFQDLERSRVVTFQILLHDEPGSLNKLLNILTKHQVNIMSINSTLPTDGCGIFTIAAETANVEAALDDLLEEFRQVPGVIQADVLAA